MNAFDKRSIPSWIARSVEKRYTLSYLEPKIKI
jgi:hypothetical protein